MKNLTFKMYVSHNEVNKDFSIMCKPSTLTVELDEEKTKTWNELKNTSPYIIEFWAQRIWELKYPKTFGKVYKVDILN